MLVDIFKSKEVLQVLDFLIDNPISQMTKTDIADGAGVSRPTIYKVLPGLIELKIVKLKRKIGNTEMYGLNTKSKLVLSLIKFDNELTDTFIEEDVDNVDNYENIWMEIPYISNFSLNSNGVYSTPLSEA
jgi:DNA-binding transcriptional ArsR family regulator